MLARSGIRALALTALALAAAACASPSHEPGEREVLVGDSDPEPARREVLRTRADDVRAGEQGAQDVEAQLGVIDDPVLSPWIAQIGSKLLRGVPRRGFEYRFRLVDMEEPNAFALPGGQIFVSRGLLALANSEDELACVLGHEIVHAAQRHAAAQQQIAQRINPLAMPWNRAAIMASYGRDMEREADEVGQRLCAAAGYDPMAMSTFMRSLEALESLRRGYAPRPSYFDSHPASRERAAANALRAGEIRRRPDAGLGDTRQRFRDRVSGLAYGPRPETGLFVGDEFLHPLLGFALSVPHGWTQMNTAPAVGAIEPRGEAVVYLAANETAASAREMADAWVEATRESERLRVEQTGQVRVGAIEAWRLRVSTAGGRVASYVTFVPWDEEAAWRITGSTPETSARLLGRTLVTARSLRPIDPADVARIRVSRIDWVQARAGEDIEALTRRSANAWDIQTTAVYNGVFSNHRFEGGEAAKILIRERWTPPSD